MTSKDKTREKLMGSMRKTKAEAGINTTDTISLDAASLEAKPASQTTNAAKPSVKKANRVTATAQKRTLSADSYQSGRRVWPD